MVAGTPENIADVDADLKAIRDIVNGQLATDNLQSAAGIVDGQLASPNNVTYKRLQTVRAAMNALGGGTWFFNTAGGTNTSGSSLASGTVEAIHLVGADFAVAGKTTKLRIRAQALCNATAPAITYTFGLYPLTVAGGANALVPTLGTVVAGSTVAIASPGSSSATTGAGTDVTIPADGAYAIGVVTSGAQAANSYVGLTAALDVRNT